MKHLKCVAGAAAFSLGLATNFSAIAKDEPHHFVVVNEDVGVPPRQRAGRKLGLPVRAVGAEHHEPHGLRGLGGGLAELNQGEVVLDRNGGRPDQGKGLR